MGSSGSLSREKKLLGGGEEKDAAPPSFPRRAGIPQKRPL